MSANSFWTLLVIVALVTVKFCSGREETIVRREDVKVDGDVEVPTYIIYIYISQMKYRIRLGSPEVGKVKRQATYEPIRLTPFYDESVMR